MKSRNRGEADRTIVVVSDTTVLINLIHIERADLFARIPNYEFTVPEEVAGEVTGAGRETIQDVL